MARFRDSFHATHRELFAIDDPGSEVEIVGLRARVSCRLVEPAAPEPELVPRPPGPPRTRSAWFRGHGSVAATVVRLEEIAVGEVLAGPALVEPAVGTLATGR